MDKKAVEIFAACTRASLRMAAMQSANMDYFVRQRPPLYKEEAFLNVIVEEGIGYNEVLGQLYHS